MGPAGLEDVGEIGDHFTGHAFRNVDDVHLWMIGLPRIKGKLLAIGGPTRGSSCRTLGIRHPHQVSSVRIAHPHLPEASATGGKGDVLPIRGVLWTCLVTCGGNQLYGRRFTTQYIL